MPCLHLGGLSLDSDGNSRCDGCHHVIYAAHVIAATSQPSPPVAASSAESTPSPDAEAEVVRESTCTAVPRVSGS